MSLVQDFAIARVGRDGAFSEGAEVAMDASRAALLEEFAANKFDATDTALLTQPDAAMGMNDLSSVPQDLLASAATLFGVDKGIQAVAAPDPSDKPQVQTTMQDLLDGMKDIKGAVERITTTFRHIADPNTGGKFDKGVPSNNATNSAQLEVMTQTNDAIDAQEEQILAARDAVEQGQTIPEGEKPGEQTAEATTPQDNSLSAGQFAASAAKGAVLGGIATAVAGPAVGSAVGAIMTAGDAFQLAQSQWSGKSTGSSTPVNVKNKEEAARAEMDKTSGGTGPVAGTFDAAVARAAAPATALPDDKLTASEVNIAKSSITDIGGARMTQTAQLDQMLAEIDVRRQQLAPQLERAQTLDQRFAEIKQDGQKLDLAGAQQAANIIGVDRIRFNGSGGPQGFTAMG